MSIAEKKSYGEKNDFRFKKKNEKKNDPTRMGFEPTRAEHIGLAVQRLNHSATSSSDRKGINLNI